MRDMTVEYFIFWSASALLQRYNSAQCSKYSPFLAKTQLHIWVISSLINPYKWVIFNKIELENFVVSNPLWLLTTD
ncbi:hypothetical protein DVG78_21160 [Runella aurantiaca]|uniref:Uncharacterized protein n=1 Tax=Runella aurantiaca TaxID=2282308 RepID=A0A369I4V6_9BACT|nr:hypothetical protein DVG78_21160 [Runella aurantiaca]